MILKVIPFSCAMAHTHAAYALLCLLMHEIYSHFIWKNILFSSLSVNSFKIELLPCVSALFYITYSHPYSAYSLSIPAQVNLSISCHFTHHSVGASGRKAARKWNFYLHYVFKVYAHALTLIRTHVASRRSRKL
jgi:hypothetical protein